jgi:hypothetical protein
MVRQAAYHCFGDLVPLRPDGTQDLYRSLTRGVYLGLSTAYYCPAQVDELLYMATVKGYRRVLEAPSEEERLTLAIAASFLEYVLLDAQGTCDRRKGIRLGESGIEVLEVFQEKVPGSETCSD